MKLMVDKRVRVAGFALPTVLLVSITMITILVTSIAAVAASRAALDSQYYNRLAQQAIESGISRANECLKANGYIPQWSTSAASRDLRPDSSCTGEALSGSHVSPYVVENIGGSSTNVRTKYTIDAPSGSGVGSSLRVIGVTELVRTSTGSVWRSYRQVSYMQIEPPETVACPEGFVAVPGDSRFNTNDFCVGKYEAKNVGGKAVSQAEGAVWVDISQVDAITAASQACTGCSLISEAQWLTIAHNVTNVAGNWTGGSVGTGSLYRGHSDNSPAAILEAAANDSDAYTGTGNVSPSQQRRTYRLNNGEIIWDFAGNAYEWTSGQLGAGKPGGSGLGWREWRDITDTGSIYPSPFPARFNEEAADWTGVTNGLGRVYSNSDDTAVRAFMRGGPYHSSSVAGPFSLTMHGSTTGGGSQTGFRVVYDPLSQIRCPDGLVPVPGNSAFGTKNFCIGKYEAKNVDGVARSRAVGAPWVSISQTDAMTAASNACGTCRLISEAEWLTVSHNALNVPSNWSGGSVGGGSIYRGHSDSVPAGNLAASTDDADGYFGTSNAGDSQRRTLKLNNGETIWDLAGNVSEWTSGQTDSGQPGAAGYAWREWNAIEGTGSLAPSPFPRFGTPAATNWTSSHGLGRAYTDSSNTGLRPFIRGGSRTSGIDAGLFSLHLAAGSPASVGSTIGFRVTSDPLSAITCSRGMIPIPGDSRFDTSDFCVGKYEAKNVGGVATSQADGLPWTTITQPAAVTAASAACANCRLIGEAEWLTIAHNVLNVPSNWSGGTVGSGFIYRGHSDGAPAGNLAASADDTDGYFGTSNAGDSQRRTLALNNGEIIWDLAGNVWEWTSGQITGGQPGAAGFAWRQWNSSAVTGSLTPNPFPSFGTPAASGWTDANGIGALYSSSNDGSLRAFRRGGGRGNQAQAGIFTLSFGSAPATTSSDIGFRIVEIK